MFASGVIVTVNARLSLCFIPATDRQPVQGAPRLSPRDSSDRLQPCCDPELEKKVKEHLCILLSQVSQC